MLSRELVTKDLIFRTEYGGGGEHLVVYLDQYGEILDISTDRKPRMEIRYQARQAGIRLCSPTDGYYSRSETDWSLDPFLLREGF